MGRRAQVTEERRMDEGVMGEKGNISAEHSQNSGVCESVSRKRQHARAGSRNRHLLYATMVHCHIKEIEVFPQKVFFFIT